MAAMIRHLAAVLVALLIPIQGYAAACAQICAANGRSHVGMSREVQNAGDHCHEAPAEAPKAPDAPQGPEEGDVPGPGLAKCCQAHVFAFDRAAGAAAPDAYRPAPSCFVVRYSSFIADEPSPPPIAVTAA